MTGMRVVLPACLLCVTFTAAQDKSAPRPDNQTQSNSVDYSSKKPRVKLGTISVGAGYSHFSGPYYRYPYGYWYNSLFWDPMWYPFPPLFHPGYLTGFSYAEDKGEVRLSNAPANAEVYLDGAYAGDAGHLKSMWLDPGAYNLSVKTGDKDAFERRIYVLTGKTLKINAGSKEGKP